jgi:hypothetical protein
MNHVAAFAQEDAIETFLEFTLALKYLVDILVVKVHIMGMLHPVYS